MAIWCANRLVKRSRSRHTRRVFYGIKDRFIRRYGREGVGQRVRHEVSECWGCDGEGCSRCDGTGIYSERWLYVHRFYVAGQRYCFHSYQEPAYLEAGIVDGEVFGSSFTETELADLALPLSALVRMLRYVDKVVWREDISTTPKAITPDIRYFWAGRPSEIL